MLRAETMADATGALKTGFINTIRKKEAARLKEEEFEQEI